MASGMVPVRRRVARHEEPVDLVVVAGDAAELQRGAQVPRGGELQRDVAAVADDALVVARAHGRRAAVDVAGDVRLHRQERVGVDAVQASRDRAAARVAHHDEPGLARRPDERDVVHGRRHGAEAGLGQPDALGAQLGEVGRLQPGLEDDRPGVDGDPAGAVPGEAALGGDGQRLDAGGIRRAAGHVDLAGGDRPGRAAVQVALQEPDGLLARRVVAERDVHVRVDEPGDDASAARVEDLVVVGGIHVGARADPGDPPGVVADQRVAGQAGRVRIDDAAMRPADVDDGHAHDTTASRGTASRASCMRKARAREDCHRSRRRRGRPSGTRRDEAAVLDRPSTISVRSASAGIPTDWTRVPKWLDQKLGTDDRPWPASGRAAGSSGRHPLLDRVRPVLDPHLPPPKAGLGQRATSPGGDDAVHSEAALDASQTIPPSSSRPRASSHSTSGVAPTPPRRGRLQAGAVVRTRPSTVRASTRSTFRARGDADAVVGEHRGGHAPRPAARRRPARVEVTTDHLRRRAATPWRRPPRR
jgi:hypothetical protein